MLPDRDRPHLVVGLLLIPQKRGETGSVRAWSDFFTKAALERREPSYLPRYYPVPGILGMGTDYAEPLRLREIGLPFWILLTLVAASCRHWLLGWMGMVVAVLLTLIAADGVVHRALQRMVDNPALPLAQRIEAQQVSARSYFHGPVRGPLLPR